MKIEIIAARIAAKTNTPALREVMLGHRPPLSLDDCMIWTGRATGAGFAIRRKYNEMIPVDLKPYGLIQRDGKTHYVHRVVYEAYHGVVGKLANICGNTLCVNPHHWRGPTSDWTSQDVTELVEIYRETNPTGPLDWDHPILAEIPEEYRHGR